MIGNIFFGLTTLFYIGMALFNFSKPVLVGDRAMGYGLGLAFFGLGCAISSLLLTLNIAWKGGFDWVSPLGSTRTLLVIVGWLSFVVAAFFCAVLKWEWHGEFPQFIRWLALSQAEIWLPLLMLVPCFLLLNAERQAGVSPLAIQIPIKIGFWLSMALALGLLFGWLRENAREQTANMERKIEEDNALQNQHLTFIAEQKPSDPIVNILALTGRFHDDIIRDSAVAKIKSHPHWEAELLELLENDYYYHHVYTFIDGNEVEHPKLFIGPLKRSIYRMAKEIENDITDSNNLQDWHFEHLGIERLFRAIDEQFSMEGDADFRPAIQALRKALDTEKPERFKTVRFNVTRVVDAWLKAHP